MFVEKLKLYQFRNLKNQEIDFSNNLNLIYGDNGEGKTNLLEAIYILSLTKSFRTSVLQDYISFQNQEASIFADIKDDDGETKNIGVSFFSDKAKKTFINHKEEVSLSNFIKNLICISFNPTDILMVKQGSFERRRFLDKHISNFNQNYLQKLIEYKKALKNKTILLRQGTSEKQIIPWNKIMADCAYDILQERISFLKELEEKAKKIYQKLAPLDGELKVYLKNTPVGIKNKESLFEKYNTYINQEIITKKPQIGIHKDDVAIFLENKEAKKYASQGQSRSIVLSLKLGVLDLIKEKTQKSPIVLLDDVDSELDDNRRNMLFSMVLDQDEQIFISATNKDFLSFYEKSKKDYNIYKIKEGLIKKE